ncbi:MAG: TIGR04283 family arsenosugar biosynthesis glycosyltransferase [Desulfarculaceae bacterium]|jgi:hypothetical protein
MPEPEKLIIFTRLPQPGQTKTRLIPVLGKQGAADLHAQLGAHTAQVARELRARRQVEVEVRYTGGGRDAASAWLGAGFLYQDQGQGGLGQRMHLALSQALGQGCQRVVLVGTDCPGRDQAYLQKAFDALRSVDLVLGPAQDGGYHLVGLSRPAAAIFQGIDWGTDQVLQQTLSVAQAQGLSFRLLAPLADVDRPEDLKVWQDAPQPPGPTASPASISVIIPTLNEARHLPAALNSLGFGKGLEVLVVDGGSRDGTQEIARSWGAELIKSPAGRGLQMALGAEAAQGVYLLFLHADTRLSPGWRQEVPRILNQPGVALGAFDFSLDQKSAGLRLVELMVRRRSRWAQLPYGDQALFLTAATLRAIGGFPVLPLMEDVELVRRASRRGRVVTSPLPALSSARRWQEKGVARTTLHNWLTLVAYYLGVSPRALARRYYRRSPEQGQEGNQ